MLTPSMLRVSCPATDTSALESGGTQLLWCISVDDDMWAMIVGAGFAFVSYQLYVVALLCLTLGARCIVLHVFFLLHTLAKCPTLWQ